MTLAPQVGDGAHDIGFRIPLGETVEQAEALGGEQFDELGAIHPATLAPRSEPLALTLHECQIAPRLDLALSQ